MERELMFYVFDIDMTLADNSVRAKRFLVDPPKKDYDGYYFNVSQDLPIYPMIRLMTNLWDTGAEIQIWTSRRETAWNGTLDWLNTYTSLTYRLLAEDEMRTEYVDEVGVRMRPFPEPQPRIKDFELKERWLTLMDRKPEVVFDDRPRVVTMYRRHGIIVCQPQPDGNF